MCCRDPGWACWEIDHCSWIVSGLSTVGWEEINQSLPLSNLARLWSAVIAIHVFSIPVWSALRRVSINGRRAASYSLQVQTFLDQSRGWAYPPLLWTWFRVWVGLGLGLGPMEGWVVTSPESWRDLCFPSIVPNEKLNSPSSSCHHHHQYYDQYLNPLTPYMLVV